MPDTTVTDRTSGVLIQGQKGSTELKVQASESGWARWLESSERTWQFTLNWIGAHPFITIIFVIAICIWRWQGHLTKVQVAGLKTDYKTARERARISSKGRK